MKKVVWMLAASVAVALWCVPVQADLTPGQKMAVEALVKNFSAPEIDARQKAVDRLVEMGVDVVPVVKKALADTADAEVKLRCEMVLKGLRDKLGAAAVDGAKAEVPAATTRDASKVTFDFNNTPLSEVVDRLAELSGNKAFHVDDKLKDKTVTCAAKDMAYWEAVDKLGWSAGLLYNTWWSMGRGAMEAKLQFVEADKDLKLTGYAGPAVVKADSVGKVELLRTAKAPAMWGQSQEGLNVALTYFWEDRLDPLSEEVELTKVATPKGDSLLPQAPDARRRANQAMMYMPGVKPAPVAAAQFLLPMPAPEARSIAELSGIVRLEYATGDREVMIDDVFAAVGKEIKVDDWTITVKKVDSQQGALVVQVAAKYKGETVDLPAFWTMGHYGWYVQTQEGAKRTRGFSSKGGGMGVWGRRDGPGAQVANPATVVQKGEGSVYFQGNYEAGAASIVLVLPKFHEVKEYPFTIKDIPLP